MEKKLSAVASRRLVRAVRGHVGRSHAESEGTATFVRRDSDGTCWVRMPGASHDTPANGGILASAEPGQTVSYRIKGTRLTVTGNASDPAAGTASVTRAVQESTDDLSELFGNGITELLTKISTDIINIINGAASGGTIDVSKLNLTDYLTSAGVSSAISNALSGYSTTTQVNNKIASAFNWTNSTSLVSQFVDWYRTNVLMLALDAIDVGGANLLGSTGWSSARDVKTSTLVTTGKWRVDGNTTLSYSNNYLIVSTTASSGSTGMVQQVAVEPSTTYLLSVDAESDSSCYVSIGSAATIGGGSGWIADGKRLWKTYKTGENQTNAYVYVFAYDRATQTKVNHIMLEKATKPSDWVPSTADVESAIAEARKVAIDYINDSTSSVDIELSKPFNLMSDVGVYAQATTNPLGPRVELTSIPQIRSGSVGQNTSIAAGGYHDFEVSFGVTYPSAPNVQLTLCSTSTATTFHCDIYLRSVSTTGFTARVFNRDSSARSPGFHWAATGSYPTS